MADWPLASVSIGVGESGSALLCRGSMLKAVTTPDSLKAAPVGPRAPMRTRQARRSAQTSQIKARFFLSTRSASSLCLGWFSLFCARARQDRRTPGGRRRLRACRCVRRVPVCAALPRSVCSARLIVVHHLLTNLALPITANDCHTAQHRAFRYLEIPLIPAPIQEIEANTGNKAASCTRGVFVHTFPVP